MATFLLCMSAPELFYTSVGSDIKSICRRDQTVVTRPGARHPSFLPGQAKLGYCRPLRMLMVWAVVCWVVTGADILPARNLVSSFGGILVLAAFSALLNS